MTYFWSKNRLHFFPQKRSKKGPFSKKRVFLVKNRGKVALLAKTGFYPSWGGYPQPLFGGFAKKSFFLKDFEHFQGTPPGAGTPPPRKTPKKAIFDHFALFR